MYDVHEPWNQWAMNRVVHEWRLDELVFKAQLCRSWETLTILEAWWPSNRRIVYLTLHAWNDH